MKLLVEYYPNDEELKLVPDGKTEKYVFDIISSMTDDSFVILMTSQEIIIEYVRVAICEKLISKDAVKFKFNNYVLLSNKYGQLDRWPDGFCDYRDKLLERLLRDIWAIHEKE